MKALLFETPWWLLVLLGGTGVGLLVSGNKRVHRPTRNAGVALVALAAILTLISWFVETDQEQVDKRSRQFVQAVEKEDWKTFQLLMQPDATLSITTLPPLYHGAGQITEAAKEARKRAGLQSVIVRSVKVEKNDPQFTSNVEVLSLQDQTAGRPLPSSWRFEWAHGPDGWTIYEIRGLKIGDVTLGVDMERQFPKLR